VPRPEIGGGGAARKAEVVAEPREGHGVDVPHVHVGVDDPAGQGVS
jgi:hypothetical protein